MVVVRLLELAPTFFDLKDCGKGETKRALVRAQGKALKKGANHGGTDGKRKSRKPRK